MNRNVVRALALDAYHQVLDNSVFRILTGLTLLPILLTFVVGLREEGVVLLFGWKEWSYEELLTGMGGNLAGVSDPQGMAIEILLRLFFDQVAGGFGILLAIAATAFFVPRLLEKGSADLYFHKPVSRTALYLSRYAAGLLFIAGSASVLVLGVFLGLAVSSHHVDPGVLLAAPTIVYVFALVFPFTMLVGVVTRSTVASILLSGLFFLFNGCIQAGWVSWEQAAHGPPLPHQSGPEGAGDADEEPATHADGPGAFTRGLHVALDVLHFVLPKTGDADVLARKVRSALAAPLWRDEEEYVAVFRLPEGLTHVEPPEPAGALVAPLAQALATHLGTLRFEARDEASGALHTLWSRPAARTTSRVGEREKVRVETNSNAAELVEDALATLPGVSGVERDSLRLPGELSAARVRWSSERDGTRVAGAAHVFKGPGDKQVFTWVTLVPAPPGTEPLAAEVERFATHLGLDSARVSEWYPEQLRIDAPWRTNLLLSLASSLLFAAATLALGAWRLARIAF